MKHPQLILGIPGPWPDADHATAAIRVSSPRFRIVGDRLIEVASKAGFDLEVYPPDPGLTRAFEIAGEGRLSQTDLATISRHRCTVYLLGKGGSVEDARAAVRAAAAVLVAGGFAVKIESTGKAHTAAYWRETAASTDLFRLYSTMVVLVGGREFFYSCGMHNLGLPDATISSDLGPAEGAHVLNNFHFYQLSEKPILKSGHTFQIAANEAVFQVALGACAQFEPDDPFHNPYGVWHLSKLGTA